MEGCKILQDVHRWARGRIPASACAAPRMRYARSEIHDQGALPAIGLREGAVHARGGGIAGVLELDVACWKGLTVLANATHTITFRAQDRCQRFY
jgi:hypothetical protein